MAYLQDDQKNTTGMFGSSSQGPTSSGSFQNLRGYLGANSGAGLINQAEQNAKNQAYGMGNGGSAMNLAHDIGGMNASDIYSAYGPQASTGGGNALNALLAGAPSSSELADQNKGFWNSMFQDQANKLGRSNSSNFNLDTSTQDKNAEREKKINEARARFQYKNPSTGNWQDRASTPGAGSIIGALK